MAVESTLIKRACVMLAVLACMARPAPAATGAPSAHAANAAPAQVANDAPSVQAATEAPARPANHAPPAQAATEAPARAAHHAPLTQAATEAPARAAHHAPLAQAATEAPARAANHAPPAQAATEAPARAAHHAPLAQAATEAPARAAHHAPLAQAATEAPARAANNAPQALAEAEAAARAANQDVPAPAATEAAARGVTNAAQAPAATEAAPHRVDNAAQAQAVRQASSNEQRAHPPGHLLHGEQPQGRLYRVRRDGQISYLFGTVHVGEKSFFPLAPEVSRALADANQLVVELDTRANAAFQQAVLAHGSYRQGDQIRRHLSPSTLAQLAPVLHGLGATVDNIAHLKPWLLANILLGLELQRAGYDRTHGIETFLLAHAAQQGTAVAELESADYQLAMFDTLSDEESERYLLQTLHELSNGTSLRKARAVLDAWRFGDPGMLNTVIADATADDSVMARFTRSTLLGKRNPEMAARIERIMGEGKTAFVGVGLLHLLGANGLPQLLAQRGYQVERMY